MGYQMKLSKNTLETLKHFSTINGGIHIRKGTQLSIVNNIKTVMAVADVPDTFTEDFCIYDLNEFLSVYSLYPENIEVVFDEKNLIFEHGQKSSIYRKAAVEMIIEAPEKLIILPSIDHSFELSEENINWITKVAAITGATHIGISSTDGKVVVRAYDPKNDAAHISSIYLTDKPAPKDYNISIKLENIKLLPGSYLVSISLKGISYFKHNTKNIRYWIALEQTSK